MQICRKFIKWSEHNANLAMPTTCTTETELCQMNYRILYHYLKEIQPIDLNTMFVHIYAVFLAEMHLAFSLMKDRRSDIFGFRIITFLPWIF